MHRYMRLIRRTRRTVWYPYWPSRTIWEIWLFFAPYLGGRGFEPVRRRCPETPPKVWTIHGATSGGPNSELIKALKKFAPPPLKSTADASTALDVHIYALQPALSGFLCIMLGITTPPFLMRPVRATSLYFMP